MVRIPAARLSYMPSHGNEIVGPTATWSNSGLDQRQ
jgi:hypothetical protein